MRRLEGKGTLLENRILILVIKDFQHRLIADVEIIGITSFNVNIDFLKPMFTKLHNIGFL